MSDLRRLSSKATMFSSTRVDCGSYLEHIYLHEDGRQLLVATVYESTRRGVFKFSCKYKLFSEDYKTVADAKHDLSQILEFNLKKPVELPV